MQNFVPLGTGNSRLMKSSIPAGTTWEQALAMLRGGTFPYDVGGLNQAGISQAGTPLNKDTLLKDATAALYGLGSDAVPDEVLGMLAGSLKIESETNKIKDIGEVWKEANGGGSVSSAGSGEVINSYGTEVCIFEMTASLRLKYTPDGINYYGYSHTEITDGICQPAKGAQKWISFIRNAKNGNYQLLVSTDGYKTYSIVNLPQSYLNGNYVGGIAYGNGIFVVVARNGYAAYSTDEGDTWHTVTNIGLSDNNIKITFVHDRFIAYTTGSNTTVAYSTNGQDWQTTTIASQLVAFAYNNGIWIATRAYDNTHYSRSTNFTTWSSLNAPFEYYNALIVGGNGVFYLAAGDSDSMTIQKSATGLANSWEQVNETNLTGFAAWNYTGVMGFSDDILFICTTYSNCNYYSTDVYETNYTLQTPTGTNVTDQVAQALGSVKVETGSYVGTETYGQSNPNSLTFSGPPILVWFFGTKNTNPRNASWGTPDLAYTGHLVLCTVPMWALGTEFAVGPPYIAGGTGSTGIKDGYSKKSSDGKTLTWYNISGAAYQLNSNVYEYFYIAFIPAGGES